jgi:hypothetical protein
MIRAYDVESRRVVSSRQLRLGVGLSGMAGSRFRTWALLPPWFVMIALGLFCECATPSIEKKIISSIR